MSKLVDCLLVVLALVVWVASTEGLVMTLGQDDLVGYLFASLIAFAAGFFVFVFWKVAFHLVEKEMPPVLRALSLGLTLNGAMTIILMSAWWTAAALGGHQAMSSQYSDLTRIAEIQLASSLQGADNYSGLVPRIDALAADLKTQADCEFTSGCVTGNRGPGGVQQFLILSAAC